jgi:branched-chain amino acid transport system substrate-binding protein
MSLIAAVTLGAWALQSSAQPPKPQGGTVRIGVINSLTGPYTAYSEPVRDGLQLALDEINAKGGIKGRKVELVVEDDGGSAAAAVKAFEKLVKEAKVSAIIGPITAAGMRATAPLAGQHKIVQVSPVAHSPDLAKAGEYVFLIAPTTDVAAREKSRLVIQRFHPKRVAMLNDANPLAEPAIAVWKEQLKAAGAEVVAEESFKEGDKDFREKLEKLRAGKPDIILYPSYYDEETVAIVKTAREIGIREPLVGSGMACLAALDKIRPLVLPELYFVDEAFGPAFSQQASMQGFIRSYSQKYNRTAGFESAAGHSALNLATRAIAAGGPTGVRMARTLRSGSFTTALGPVKYGASGANTAARFALFNMGQRGEMALVR